MDKIKKQFTLQNLIQFIKLQLAGNILFWGTYIGFYVLHEQIRWSEVVALTVASLIAHALFFVANKEWVFDEDGANRKSSAELVRFVIFMGINFFINIGIIYGLSQFFGISPYIGQFISGLFFTLWTYVGLKFWVFREAQHHASLRARRRKYAKRQQTK